MTARTALSGFFLVAAGALAISAGVHAGNTWHVRWALVGALSFYLLWRWTR